jgi:hypothetical protein
MNSTFDTVIVVTVICGLLMVVGGMVLLYKGTITLKDSSPDEAIKVEFKRMINITTRYPALGLFIIGLVFTVVALYFAQSQAIPPFTIDGKLQTEHPADATVLISYQVYKGNPDSDGTINQVVYPVLDNVLYQIVVPGNSDEIRGSKPKKNMEHGVLKIGAVSPAAKTEDKPKPGKIVEDPGLPAPDTVHKF